MSFRSFEADGQGPGDFGEVGSHVALSYACSTLNFH